MLRQASKNIYVRAKTDQNLIKILLRLVVPNYENKEKHFYTQSHFNNCAENNILMLTMTILSKTVSYIVTLKKLCSEQMMIDGPKIMFFIARLK